MIDKIQILTDKLYEEGIQKAKTEGESILQKAHDEAAKINEEAIIKAEQLLKNALAESLEMQKNIDGEIKVASRHAFNMVRQAITNMVTLQTTKKLVNSQYNDPSFIKEIMFFAVHTMIQHDNDDSFRLILPENLDKKLKQYLEHNIHETFENQIVMDVSQNFESGFRIGPSSGNYQISFTEKDFENFFKHLLRPKTVELLFDGNRSE
jgi:V/A-type H+-transporting ATPase subunit E